MLVACVCAVIAAAAFGYAIVADRGVWAVFAVAVLIYGMLPLLRRRMRRQRAKYGDAGSWREARHVRLGHLLVHTYGWITPGQLRRALTRQKGTRQLLGAILLEMGVLTAMQLETALDHQRRLDTGGVAAGAAPERPTQSDGTKPLLSAR